VDDSSAIPVKNPFRLGGVRIGARLTEGVFWWRRSFVFAGACVLVLLGAQGCEKTSNPAPGVTLTLIDEGWLDKEFQGRRSEELRRFTKESGIPVEVLPAPESAEEIVAIWQKLLESGAKVPDVYAVDVVWPGVFADYLLDLKAYVPALEIAAHFPQLIPNYTIKGRLVALPYAINIGLLFYRADLLRRYGYGAPPKTWEELESMAARIQRGERARGKKDFWGFVWQGALTETLTCNALEWQVSEGGGTIIENGEITVNNPQTVRAWERAAHWIGFISPPGVVEYKAGDAFNVWQAGQTAFMRNWAEAYPAARARASAGGEELGIAPLPGGRAGIAGTVGGHGYGVSLHSQHPREAAMLVRFLCRRDTQLLSCRNTAEPPSVPEVYQDAQVMAANPYFSRVLEAYQKGATLRPSMLTGKAYPTVSRAYFEAVHSVLTGEKSAARAAAELERTLVQITGVKPLVTPGSAPHGPE
jgi:trehalose/maltose transport system substrate-binding protein